jgi:thiol-disulfide isomerase/thioredoxin
LRKAAGVKLALLPPRLEVAAGSSPSVGPADAPVTIVEFADYQCPYCHQMEPTLASIREQYGDRIRFVYKDFPLPMHQYAEKAAEAALCAGQQGQYWAYHDALFAGTAVDELQIDGLKKTAASLKLDQAKFASCLDSGAQAAVITQNLNEGKAMGLVARNHSAQPLVLGNGEHLGYFVIAALRVASTQMTAVGDVIAMTVHLELKEWALSSELDPTVPPQPDFAPIAMVPAPEGEETTAVTYSGALGVATTIAPASSTYAGTVTGAPGVSPLLSGPAAGASNGPLSPDDVPAETIVRSAV